MGAGDDHGLRAGLLEHADGAGDGAAGVDHVVHQDAVLAVDVADDAVGHDLVRCVDVAGLVHERHGGVAEHVGPLLRRLHAAGVGGDHHEVVQRVLGLDVVHQDRLGVHVVHRAVEEALDLVGVQVHGDDAVRAGGGEQVRDQAGGDRLAAAVLLVLAGVRVERQDRGDALSGAALERVDHDQLFHQPLVQRLGVGLHDKAVGAADGLFEADEDLAVGEVARGGGHQLDAELFGHGFCEVRVGASGEDLEVLVVFGGVTSHEINPLASRFSQPLPLRCPGGGLPPSLRCCAGGLP